MSDFKVGDVIRRIHSDNSGRWNGFDWVLPVGTFCIVTKVHPLTLLWVGVPPKQGGLDGHNPGCFELVASPHAAPLYPTQPVPPLPAPFVPYVPARSTDPATSKKAAKKAKRAKVADRIVDLLKIHTRGLTGGEIAWRVDAKLNSVTPRFAELRRAGRIVDAGITRDGQTVWRLA